MSWGALKAPAFGLAQDALGKGGIVDVGVVDGGAFDASGIADRACVAHRESPLVALFGAPDGAELCLARFSAAVGLFAWTPAQLSGAHGNAGAVHTEIERWQAGVGWRRLDSALFVCGDLFAQSLGRALDVLGVEGDSGQGRQQLGAFLETHQRSDLSHHAQDPRRQRSRRHAEGPVPRAEPATAGGTVIVGALQRQRSEGRLETLAAATGVVGDLAAVTAQGRLLCITVVGVESTLDHARGEL